MPSLLDVLMGGQNRPQVVGQGGGGGRLSNGLPGSYMSAGPSYEQVVGLGRYQPNGRVRVVGQDGPAQGFSGFPAWSPKQVPQYFGNDWGGMQRAIGFQRQLDERANPGLGGWGASLGGAMGGQMGGGRGGNIGSLLQLLGAFGRGG